jgi:Raf kinase inhibitor-like YbhB/YbcL family protein
VNGRMRAIVSSVLAPVLNLLLAAGVLGNPMAAFQLKSSVFSNGGAIPPKFTCDGSDLSPALSWNDPPTGTKAFALIMDDPDAPAGTWVHWVLYDLPASVRELPEGEPKAKDLEIGARQGSNDFQRIGYGGPCPPRGAAHRYSFRLYALDRPTQLPAGAAKRDLERAMKGHILAQSELVGRFQH